jgi:hypothetical protein
LLVALAGQFQFEGSGEGLLARFGAISTLQGILYWSVSDHRWRTLITHARALDGPDLSLQRPDFTPAEMKRARGLYFAHDDNRTSAEVIYRLGVLELTPNRLVLTTENVSPVRKFMLTLAEPGGLPFIFVCSWHKADNAPRRCDVSNGPKADIECALRTM